MSGRGRPKRLGERAMMVSAKVPLLVHERIMAAAQANYESPASYVRRAIIAQLRADGLLPATGDVTCPVTPVG